MTMPCIACGKPRCDGHDEAGWKRCAERWHKAAIQAEMERDALKGDSGEWERSLSVCPHGMLITCPACVAAPPAH